MVAKKCNKCHTELDELNDNVAMCPNCWVTFSGLYDENGYPITIQQILERNANVH